MNKEQAFDLLHTNIRNANLRRHCYAVSYAMCGIYDYLKEHGTLSADAPSKEIWKIFGILHDADYELTKNDSSKHTVLTLEWIEKGGVSRDDSLYLAIQSHNNKYTHLRDVQTQMEWALECCDELTGFIVACALVQPDKKLKSVEVKSILKKWKQPAFARQVDRNQIEQCETELRIPLDDFVAIVLTSMQSNAKELGL